MHGLQQDGVPLAAALWVREVSDTGGDDWVLWLAPKTFQGRTHFYALLAEVLTKLQPQIGYFEIANVRAIEPTSFIMHQLRRFGKIDPTQPPRYLVSENLGGVYIQEAIVLLLD